MYARRSFNREIVSTYAVIFPTKAAFPVKTMELHLDRFSAEEKMRINHALDFATKYHEGQKRKDGKTPYIVHPIAAAQALIDEFHADADTVIAALLHDTVEDTDATLEDIEREFGPTIRFLVDGVTDYGQFDGNPHIPDKMERKEYAKKKTLEYAKKDKRVLLVKIADRWDNMKSVHTFRPKSQVGYAKDTIDFQVKACRELGFARQADEFQALCEQVIKRWEGKL